ncbi:hypothetical protein EYF80_000701 [Liparis tanakae]|uniref:Uncharacterized protein n=1 Tax=Liparis tanakae TaxID=230148 RepID=A0A4Z2JG98_9TELE|nr:hypothetical protein EYF80_000701 [Liparis tanakae]
MYTPEGRQTHAEHAGPTPDTRRARWTNARHTQSTLDQRQTHAEHALGIRSRSYDVMTSIRFTQQVSEMKEPPSLQTPVINLSTDF